MLALALAVMLTTPDAYCSTLALGMHGDLYRPLRNSRFVVDTAIPDDMYRRAAANVDWVTDGKVFWARGQSGLASDIQIVIEPPAPGYEWAAALTYLRVRGREIVGARIVVQFPEYLDAGLVIHEAGHTLGFGHAGGRRDQMGGTPDPPGFSERERECARWMFEQPLPDDVYATAERVIVIAEPLNNRNTP